MSLDLAALTAELIAFPSHESETEVQRFIARALDRLGLRVELQEVLPGRFNVVATRGEGGPLLCSHADTFPPYDHPDPFTLRREGDLLIGRAVNDTKGQIAALLAALEASRGPCEVAITADEERLGRGSLALAPRAAMAVVLEPTDLAICPAQGGFLECEVRMPGRPAHGTQPQYGHNAILAAVDCYRAICALPYFTTDHPLLGPPWTTLGTIAGGYEVGVVPPFCTIRFDLGIWPHIDLAEARAAVAEVVAQFGGTLTILDESPGFELDSETEIVRRLAAAVARAGRTPRLGGMASWTDAQNLVLKGIPAVVFGAGELGTAHSDRETVRLSDLGVVRDTLKHLIDDWVDWPAHAEPNTPA
ncbi:MAG: M20/M25/M40 family metallo-hydrolase [Chloroflexota bacterium]|nr:M20/M25/M40 family metallo-hydrolase [Dehalococcoidia bacterium]MDW8252277.1 M20/M25/M40 family metallo-hydrolase [Chloroflexota bacterium]